MSESMLGRCSTTLGLFLKRRLQGLASRLARLRHASRLLAISRLIGCRHFNLRPGCATPLLKHPSRVPGCLIICRPTSRALPSFISVAVGYAADMRLGGAPETCCEWPALAAAARVVLFDTAVLVILALNMLAPGRYRRGISCLRISLPYIVGPQLSSLSAIGQVGQECWRVEARQCLLLVRPFSSRLTFHAGLLQLFCDFDPDGTCLADVRVCRLRFVCSLSLLRKYHCRPPFNQTLRTLWAAIPLDRIDDTTPRLLLGMRLRD